jgi:hypothetical protein
MIGHPLQDSHVTAAKLAQSTNLASKRVGVCCSGTALSLCSPHLTGGAGDWFWSQVTSLWRPMRIWSARMPCWWPIRCRRCARLGPIPPRAACCHTGWCVIRFATQDLDSGNPVVQSMALIACAQLPPAIVQPMAAKVIRLLTHDRYGCCLLGNCPCPALPCAPRLPLISATPQGGYQAPRAAGPGAHGPRRHGDASTGGPCQARIGRQRPCGPPCCAAVGQRPGRGQPRRVSVGGHCPGPQPNAEGMRVSWHPVRPNPSPSTLPAIAAAARGANQEPPSGVALACMWRMPAAMPGPPRCILTTGALPNQIRAVRFLAAMVGRLPDGPPNDVSERCVIHPSIHPSQVRAGPGPYPTAHAWAPPPPPPPAGGGGGGGGAGGGGGGGRGGPGPYPPALASPPPPRRARDVA